MKRAIAIGAALLLLPLLVLVLVAQSPPPSQAPPPPPTYTLTDLGRMDLSAAPSGPTAISSNGQVAGLYFNYTTQVNRAFVWRNGTLAELGTLGGSLSFGYGVNSAGQVVGSSSLPTPTQRAFIWQNSMMTNLGDPTGDSNLYSAAFAINTAGDVGGYENRTVVTPIIWKGGTHAGATVLSSLPCQFNFCAAQVLALNDAGQAAGFGTGPYVTGPAGSYNATQAVMWDANGQATGLGSLGNYVNDHANAINSQGAVVGYSQIDASTVHAVLWQNGTMTDLGAIPGIDPLFGANANITDNNSSAWGINSKGDVVGISAYGTQAVTQGNGGRAFLYTNGTMYDLLSLVPGTNWKLLHAAWAINDAGQIVGVGIDPTTNTDHGFLLTPIITPTTTALSSSVNPSAFGQQVSFSVTVTPTQSSALTPTGIVTFNDGSTVLGTVALSSGTAIFNASGLGVGSHSITASYGGDNQCGSSTSVAVTQVVNRAGTTTALTASPNPANIGQSVTLTATVTVVAPGAGTPTGTVNFRDGTTSTSLGTVVLNSAGSATISTSSLATGSHSLTATYGGDTNFSGSASAATNLSVVLPAPAITSPASGFSTTNSSVTVTGTGAFGALVAILDGTATVANIPVDPTGNFSLTITPGVGVHSLTATQTLGAATSAASAAVTVTVAPNAPAITSPASGFSTTSPSVTVTGTGVSGASVTVLDGPTTVGTGTVSSAGSFGVTVTLAVGPNSLTATQTLNGVTSAASAAVTGTVLPPPVVVTDNETITVNDTMSFPDVSIAEAVHVNDAVFVTPLINVAAPVAEFSAGTLGFSGQSGSQTITVSDIGTASLTVASATISGSSQFTVTQIVCSNVAVSFSTTLPLGGTCVLTIGYSASATPTNDNGTLVFTDNAALSNVASVPAGSNYTQSIPLKGAGTTTPPPPPPPAVIPILDNETITVNDTMSFPDVSIAEAVHVNDAVFVTPLINVSAPVADYSAGSVGFGNVAAGQIGTQSLTLSDIGQASLTVSSATLPPGSAFAIPQIACSNGAVSLPTTLPVGGVCIFLISYSAQPSGAGVNDVLTFTDNAALSNVASAQAGSSYTQSIALNGSGTSTPPPPPPPAVIPILDNEMVHVMDVASFPDVLDSEKITVTDQVSIQLSTTTSISVTGGTVYGTPASVVVSVGPSTTVAGNVTLSVDGGTPSTLSLTNGSATFNNLGVLKAGNHSLVANFAAQGSFMGSSAQGTLAVIPAMPTITWATPTAITYGTQLSSTQLNATASVAGTFTYKPAAGAVLTGGSQTLTVAFTPTDIADYTTATATVTLLVNPATPTITWATPAAITYGTQLSSTQLNATSPVAGTFTYKPAAGAVLTVGSQTLTVAFIPADMTDYMTATATVTLQVNQATPTITWATPAAITYGTQLSSTQLNATSPVAGTLVYNPPAGTVLGAGNQTISVVFAPNDKVDYTKANGSITLVVNQATPTINWANPPAITYGTALSAKQLNATSPVAGTLVYNPPAGTVLGAGNQTLSVVLAPNDKVDYTKANASVTLVVNQATPVITWANPASITQGTPLSGRQLNATASVRGVLLAGKFIYNPPLNTVLGAGTQSLSVTFTPADATDYQIVTASVSITVNVTGNLTVQSGQTVTFTNGSISGNVTLSGGTLTLNNSTVGGNLTMSSGNLTLRGNSTVGGNLTMSSGNLTLGGNSTVGNGVLIQGGSFSVGPATIKGNLVITNVPAGSVPGVVCGASVNGNLQFSGNGIPGQIGPASCSGGNTISGNLLITNNTVTAPLQIYKNSVGSNLQITGNTSSAQVFLNTVQGSLQCSSNSSPFTGGRNTAASKQGQCASF